jgi:hypothetical protein
MKGIGINLEEVRVSNGSVKTYGYYYQFTLW